MMENIW